MEITKIIIIIYFTFILTLAEETFVVLKLVYITANLKQISTEKLF